MIDGNTAQEEGMNETIDPKYSLEKCLKKLEWLADDVWDEGYNISRMPSEDICPITKSDILSHVHEWHSDLKQLMLMVEVELMRKKADRENATETQEVPQ